MEDTVSAGHGPRRRNAADRAPTESTTACLWPFCSRVIAFNMGKGRKREFCGPRHKQQFLAMRADFHHQLQAIESRLFAEPGLTARHRKLLEAERRRLHWHLRRFPEDVSTARGS